MSKKRSSFVALVFFFHELFDEGLNNFTVTPSSWMETETWSSLFVDKEFFKVPSDIVCTDWIVHKFVAFTNLKNSLWATVLKNKNTFKNMKLKNKPNGKLFWVAKKHENV